MKKLIAVLTVVFLTMSMLVGCGSSKNAANDELVVYFVPSRDPSEIRTATAPLACLLYTSKSIEEAIDKCMENSERDCWVYLEISTDRYINEDEIKTMKSYKKDILEIMPKIIGLEKEDEEEGLSEKSFEDIFKDFYRRERDVEATEEVIDLLMSIISKEGNEDETN